MGIQPNDRVSIERVCQEYMLGLSWIMHYYCKGCASWNWFYPEHYAPLLRDLSAMNNVTVSFELGEPLSKIEANIAVRIILYRFIIDIYSFLFCSSTRIREISCYT